MKIHDLRKLRTWALRRREKITRLLDGESTSVLNHFRIRTLGRLLGQLRAAHAEKRAPLFSRRRVE